MTRTSVEDTDVATYLAAAERLFRMMLTDTEQTIHRLKSAAEDGDGKTVDDVRQMIRKLAELGNTLVKEGSRIEERLERERGPRDQFALDLEAAKLKVCEQLGKLARTNREGSAVE